MHCVDHLNQTAGLSESTTASVIFLPLSICLTATSFATGIALDYVTPRRRVRVAGVFYLGMSLVMIFANYITSAGIAVLFGSLYGILVGCMTCMYNIILASVFGTQALGRMQGISNAMGVASTGLGPLLFGAVRDSAGSYGPAIMGTTVGVACSGVLLLLIPVPGGDTAKSGAVVPSSVPEAYRDY